MCTGCHFVWFDPQEFESLPKCPPKPIESDPLSPKAKEAIAMASSTPSITSSRPFQDSESDGPDHWWQFIVALCGIPVEYNDTPLKNRPIVTWLLAAVIAVVSLVAFTRSASRRQ